MLPITWRSTPTYVDLPKEGQYPKPTPPKPSEVVPKICFSFWSSGPLFWSSGPSFWSSGPSFLRFGPLFWSSGPLFWSSWPSYFGLLGLPFGLLGLYFGLLGLHFGLLGLYFGLLGPHFGQGVGVAAFSSWPFGRSFPFLMFSKSLWPRFATRASPKW